MSQERKLLFLNWKSNKTKQEAAEWANLVNVKLKDLQLTSKNNLQIVLFAPHTLFYWLEVHLKEYETLQRLSNDKMFQVGSQVVSEHGKGGFTGYINAEQAADMGVRYTLVGHSERRAFAHETNEEHVKQLAQAFEHGIAPVFCIGETKDEKDEGQTYEVMTNQLAALQSLSKEQLSQVTIAYEPRWAIATGRTADPATANEICGWIKDQFSSMDVRPPVIYGGSVDGKSILSFLSQPNIDGVLPGGASLKPDEVGSMVQFASEMA